jgi:hypothetical protein
MNTSRGRQPFFTELTVRRFRRGEISSLPFPRCGEWLFLAFLSSILLWVGAANAATLTVTSTEDFGKGSLRYAILNAAPGDTINFDLPSGSVITLTSDSLVIQKSLTITGPGSSLLKVERSHANGIPDFRVFRVDLGNLDVTIFGLTISNGKTGGRGGAIYSTTSGVTAISDCNLIANTGLDGGAIANESGTLNLTNSTVRDNYATDAASNVVPPGGAIYNRGTLTIAGCWIHENSGVVIAGINNGGIANISNSTISNNFTTSTSSDTAGGIYNETKTLTISNSTIAENFGVHGGGIYNGTGTVIVNNVTISGNYAQVTSFPGSGSGGGIYNVNGGTVKMRSAILAGNQAFGAGGGPNAAGTLTLQGFNLIGDISGASISGAAATDQLGVADAKLDKLKDNGGRTPTVALLPGSPAIDKGNTGFPVYLTQDQRGFARPVDSPTIANATGGDGSDIGAYEVQGDQLPGCGNTLVTNNNDSGSGSLRSIIANVCLGETITFASSVISPINLTSGELSVDKAMTISGPGANVLTIQRGASASTNFSIFRVSGTGSVSLSGLTIAKGNSSFGGGIYCNVLDNTGTLTVSRCVITGNSAPGAGAILGKGGGIYNQSKILSVINTTVSTNSTTGDGGGIASDGASTTVTNCTISGNSAARYSGGIHPSGTLTITNSTVANNSAGTGGGIRNGGYPVTLRTTILAKNTATTSDPDISGDVTSAGSNFIGNNSGATITPAQPSDQIGTAASPKDPLLGPLQNNGGGTPTHALLSGSTAIDKGRSSSDPASGETITTDQRGFSRPVDNPAIPNVTGGDGSDIGAFEVQLPTVLANISTRLRVETGDNALIGGFIVTGTQNKKVIIRAIGPSLGLVDELANPTLELYSGQTLLKANDDWMNSSPADKQAIIDSTIPPTNDLESAIVATLPANGAGYTAVLRGVNNGTGIGVIQIYDLDRSVDSKLANISTRGFVQTGDNVLFAGTIVLGQAPQKVIIRALGPSVSVPGAMADPTLELRDGNGVLLDMNDNWKDSANKQAIIDSTVPPTKDAESAIVYNLPANGANYTAIVRGAGGTTGIAVVEVYALN